MKPPLSDEDLRRLVREEWSIEEFDVPQCDEVRETVVTGICKLCHRHGVEVSGYGYCSGKDLSGCRFSLATRLRAAEASVEWHRRRAGLIAPASN